MTTDSEEETESEFKKKVQVAVERVMKPGKKRAMEPAMERVIERTMEPMMERVMEPMIEQVMEREMKQVMKRETREIKRLIGTVNTPGALADQYVNPRTSVDHQMTRSVERKFWLRFVNKLHDTFFTKDKIIDENGRSVEIQLINTSNLVVKEGYLSSIEVEILVLEGDLGFKVHEDWTEQQFNAKIVRQREGKGSLVKGKQNITLKDGVGTIEDLSFTDISRWIKCKKFRLGVRFLQSSSSRGQVRIKEAISEAFEVRDYRTKMNKKNYLPSLDDEVRHLKKIKRGGKFHTRLIDNDIQTIRNFKQMYKTNPIKLRAILKDCLDPEWEVMVQHADGIVDDDNSNPLRSQEAEAYNTATTGPPLHQGSSGMQNDSNRASSSQPPTMSIPHSHFNAQLELSNDNHQLYNTQSNDFHSFPSSNTHEPHAHFSAAQYSQITDMPLLNNKIPNFSDIQELLRDIDHYKKN